MSMKLDHKSALKLKLNLVPKNRGSSKFRNQSESDGQWLYVMIVFHRSSLPIYTRVCFHPQMPPKSTNEICQDLHKPFSEGSFQGCDQSEMSYESYACNSDEVCSQHVCLHFAKQCNSSILCQNYWNKKKDLVNYSSDGSMNEGKHAK